MSSLNAKGLIEVTPEAAKWRDLDPKLLTQERNVRVGMIAVSIVLVLGIIFASYFTSHIELANIFVPVFTSIFGGGGAIALFVGSFVFNLEGDRERELRDPNEAVIDGRKALLTQGKLSKLYNNLFPSNRWERSIAPYVHLGLLTPDEAKTIRETYITPYREAAKTVEEYKAEARKGLIDLEGENVPKRYSEAASKEEQLQTQWAEYQKTLTISKSE